ncbi:XRE family transcriptional regulator [Wukongibacter baidiensis]|uniref:helix-turn-helix domain-containing protein n=1 Tax=Wukongibacter baidiensis TaxID=1723361 RepID=UPI003D7F6159
MIEISKEIRRIRKMKDITLKELSEKTGLSVSFLSQIERGVSSMAITSLKKIADALDVPMKKFFDEESDLHFMRKKEEQKFISIERSNMQYKRLSGMFEGRKLESILLTYKPNSGDTEEISHEGEEFYYVLQGEATFTIDRKKYVIKEGETIHFPSTLPHSLSNNSDVELKMLSILTQLVF